MDAATVRMCVRKYHMLLLFALTLHCEALNCRTDGGPKADELKSIYRNCLKKQDGKNSSQSRGFRSDDDWRDSKGPGQRSSWDRDGKFGRDDRRDDRNGRDDGSYRDGMYGNDRSSSYDRMGSNSDRVGSGTSYDKTSSYDKMGNNYDRIGSSYDKMGDRTERNTRNDRMGGRSETMGSRYDGYGRSQATGRDDFAQMDGFGDEISPYSNYGSSTQSSRRYKREKRIGRNSGQRSQYNPNTSNRPSYDDYRNEDRNTSSNSSKHGDNKACAMHCFLEKLEMTGDNGMPDRYLVTHAITKDVKNEDLRDFLQESIEECFQILDNENTEDKCKFSKNLLMCLSEKGRANCDDWKDDIQF